MTPSQRSWHKAYTYCMGDFVRRASQPCQDSYGDSLGHSHFRRTLAAQATPSILLPCLWGHDLKARTPPSTCVRAPSRPGAFAEAAPGAWLRKTERCNERGAHGRMRALAQWVVGQGHNVPTSESAACEPTVPPPTTPKRPTPPNRALPKRPTMPIVDNWGASA